MTNGLDLNQLHTVQVVPVTPFDKEGQVTPLNDNLTLAKVIQTRIKRLLNF